MAFSTRSRASAIRGHGAVLFLCALAGCDHARSLDPESGGTAPTVEAVPPGGPYSAEAAFAGGIPIGLFAQPLSEYGPRYNGGHRNSPPTELVNALETIRSQGGRVFIMLAGSQSNYKDADGHFSLSLWQSRVDRYRAVDFSSYVNDGTVIAHYILDEPDDPTNWNNQPVPGATVETMAAYSKQIWPSLPTVVRVEPGYLAKDGTDYRQLDAAWAQYVYRKGEINAYLGRNVTDAQTLGLELVVGLNLLTGSPERGALTAGQVVDWGSVLLGSSYPCAFVSYQYNATYLAGAGIGDAMDVLRGLAQNRPSKPCHRLPPADPDPPAATATTIDAADPDPSVAGGTVTVAVTVASNAGTPAGTVNVTADGGTESCHITLSGGGGTCGLVLESPGSRTIRASFDGGSEWGGSSDAEAHQVEAAPRQSVTLSWPTPADVTYGTALGATQLNALATAGGEPVAGSFSYTPAAGTVLDAGPDQTLRVDFTPADPTRHESGSATVSLDVLPRAPTLAWSVPLSTSVGPLSASLLSATATGVGGGAIAGTFTYTPAAGQTLDAAAAQTLSVSFLPSSGNYAPATRNVSIAVLYPWTGFFSPVDNAGRLNTAKAGVAIPVRFSLGGNQPAPVLAAGYPEARSVSCPGWPKDAIEETVAATGSELTFDAASGRYVYIWKTSTTWANKCWRLSFVFKDGTRREATFRLSR